INLKDTAINFMALSGHKLHAVKGIGALYLKKGTRFQPFIIGGHQENDRRAGTENVPGIVGLGKAAELAKQNLEEESSRVRSLRDRLQEGILNSVQFARINGSLNDRLPNTLNIGFEFVEGESILLKLDELGICASSGSACTSGSLEPSHVLRAMGVPFTCVHGSIRFSLSRYNTQEEIDFVTSQMSVIINSLRAMSPFGQDKISSACIVQ
ncbi:MAG: aminotransferase class V-fold PLP-dependent enzyme, partial [Desulfomonilaceae bacterium]